MALNYTEIKKLADVLAAYVRLKHDYRMYIDNKRKLLLVEGITDKNFVSRVQAKCVDCITAATVFSSNAQFRTNAPNITSRNCRNAIVTIISSISYCPSPFIMYPDDLDKWELYGLVDLDYDEMNQSRPIQRLLVTDTRDLETMILSTDEDLLIRLEKCEISKDEVNKAYFLAYQLAVLRNLLGEYHEELCLLNISCGSRQVAFPAFVRDYRINISDLINYINKESGYTVSAFRVKRMIDNISNGKAGKKIIDADGNWKQQLNDFMTSMPPDFWEIVNGHDILQLLLYISANAFMAFNDSQGYSLNRTFELSIIDEYNYSQFEKTILKEKMFKAGLID